MTFFRKSLSKCGDTGNGAMSQEKRSSISEAILLSILKHPIAGVTNSFKGTAGLLEGSSTFAPRGENKCPG